MSNVTIWHNPKCSKSRQTLALLQERGIEPLEIHYLTDPRNRDQIEAALLALNSKAIDMMRTGEAIFSELGLTRNSPQADLIDAMANNPTLIERPIVFANGKAAIGRPPSAVLTIL